MKFILLGLLLYSCLLLLVNAWNVPPANFIHDFMSRHQLISVTIYLPEENKNPWGTWHKKFFLRLAHTTYFQVLRQLFWSTFLLINFQK